MSITPEQTDIWRSVHSETQNLEFKEPKNQYDNKKLRLGFNFGHAINLAKYFINYFRR